MKSLLLRFLIGMPVLFVIDYLWLDILARDFYLERLSSVLLISDGHMDPRVAPAVGVYIAMSFGLAYFCSGSGKAIKSQAAQGALLGLIIYSVYEFTNYALLSDWHPTVVTVDILWGCVLLGLSNAILATIDRKWITVSRPSSP